jgi:hypothetical protein
MGHLKMDTPVGEMRKFVISFWFRVPAATVQKAYEHLGDGFGTFRVYAGVVPLIAWGVQPTGDRGAGGSGPMPPSYIGVKTYNSLDGSRQTTLEVHIQTKDIATGDTNQIYPDYFGNSMIDAVMNVGQPKILVDHWNHVILSCDLHSHSDASCKMWCAINDVDISGLDINGPFPRSGLPAMGPGVASAGANDHCSAAVFGMLGVTGKTVNLNMTNIPSKPFCVPAPAPVKIDDGGTINPVLKVEMAELQVFDGVTLDTSVTARRRVFVDKNGLPVPPGGAANTLLGKKPQILLAGSSDWEAGHNSGSLGGNAAGQFKPTGKILAWSPDPSLHGPQSRLPPAGVRLGAPAAASQ